MKLVNTIKDKTRNFLKQNQFQIRQHLISNVLFFSNNLTCSIVWWFNTKNLQKQNILWLQWNLSLLRSEH